nr:MAG TPA: hypothetical protein [Caudoviricetes sp.]
MHVLLLSTAFYYVSTTFYYVLLRSGAALEVPLHCLIPIDFEI